MIKKLEKRAKGKSGGPSMNKEWEKLPPANLRSEYLGTSTV